MATAAQHTLCRLRHGSNMLDSLEKAPEVQGSHPKHLDMVFLVKYELPVDWPWRRRLPRASQNNHVVLGTLQRGSSPRRRVKDVAPLASAFGVLDEARCCL